MAWRFTKLNENGISGNLLELLPNFLFCQKQRVVLNGQHSFWGNVTAEVFIFHSPYYFLFTQMIYQMIFPQIVDFLLMIRLFFQW